MSTPLTFNDFKNYVFNFLAPLPEEFKTNPGVLAEMVQFYKEIDLARLYFENHKTNFSASNLLKNVDEMVACLVNNGLDPAKKPQAFKIFKWIMSTETTCIQASIMEIVKSQVKWFTDDLCFSALLDTDEDDSLNDLAFDCHIGKQDISVLREAVLEKLKN